MGQATSTQELMPTPQAGQTWPDGWYVYESGCLNGPFTAAETFNRAPELEPGKPLLVSRKGFSQWYPLRDLSEIYLASVGTVPQVQQRPKVMAKIVGRNVAPTLSVAASDAVRPHISVDRVQPTVPRKLTTAEIGNAKKSKNVASVSSSHAKKAVLQEYFLARTRLRLGKIRNPWVSAFVGTPLSLGAYWPAWFAAVQKEMLFHTHSVTEQKGASTWSAFFAVVPVLHFYLTFKLAAQVRAMEAQNKYLNTSPAFATALAVFPPLAMAYLQRALNRHWLLHAKHLVVKRRTQAGSV